MKMYLPPPGARRSSRRGFLKKGLIGGALLALGGAFLATRRTALVELPAGLQVLDARRYAVVRALAERFIPPRPGFPPPDTLQTAKAVDHILTLVDPTTREDINRLLMLFENALPNFLFGLRTLPFTQMAPDEQQEVLEEWMTSRLAVRRTGYLALRTIVMGAYYGQPQSWPAVHYPGPPPGVYDPNAPAWKGGDVPRPPGLGVMREEPPTP